MGILIEDLNAVASAEGADVMPAMRSGATIKLSVDQIKTLIVAAITDDDRIRYLATGVALPSSNVGPIFHEDYGCILTWQVFNANGANYTGYASENIGQWANEGQICARRGWLKRNGATLLKADFPALWNYALHKGLVGVWAVGTIVFGNTSGTQFKLPDTRGYFDRPWSDGAGMDSGRAFGSKQLDQMQQITGGVQARGSSGADGTATGAFSTSSYDSAQNLVGSSAALGRNNIRFDSANSPGARTGDETRPVSTAPLGVLKF